MPLADVIYDQKEMKRVDGINSVPNGKPQQIIEEEYDDEDEDDEDYLEEDEED